jgi:hypothetical protein
MLSSLEAEEVFESTLIWGLCDHLYRLSVCGFPPTIVAAQVDHDSHAQTFEEQSHRLRGASDTEILRTDYYAAGIAVADLGVQFIPKMGGLLIIRCLYPQIETEGARKSMVCSQRHAGGGVQQPSPA